MKNQAYTERATLHCAPIATQITEGLHRARFVNMRTVLSVVYSHMEGDKTHSLYDVLRSPGQTDVHIDFPPSQGRLQRLEHFVLDHTMHGRAKKTQYDSFDMASFVVGQLLTGNGSFTVEEPYHMEPGEAYYVACEGDPHHTIAVLGTNEPQEGLTIPAPENGVLAIINLDDLLPVFPGAELRRPVFE